MMSFRQERDVDWDDVWLGKELIEGNVLGVGDGLDPVGGRVGVIAEDLVAKSGDLLNGLLADQAGADDADVLVLDQDALKNKPKLIWVFNSYRKLPFLSTNLQIIFLIVLQQMY